jgi:hypothetical protein
MRCVLWGFVGRIDGGGSRVGTLNSLIRKVMSQSS